MVKYLYHMLFDPISQWEKFKFELTALGATLVIVTVSGLMVVIVNDIKAFLGRRGRK